MPSTIMRRWGPWAMALILISLSGAVWANAGPGPAPILPPGIDPGQLDPACVQGCMDEYYSNLSKCRGALCLEIAQSEFDACIGACACDC